MALFRRKKTDPNDAATTSAAHGGSGGDGSGSGDGAESFQPQPEKARKWYEHGGVAADRFDYDYALTCFAMAVKLDPEPMSFHEAMYEAAIKYMGKGGKAASGREVRTITDNTAVSRFAAAEFAWMKDLKNPSLALKALDAAVKAEQHEPAHWMAPRVLNLIKSQKKPNKSMLIQAKDHFKAVGAWDQAIEAGEIALRLDPSNNDLEHEIKDISAQRAMDQGGYEKAAGEEGGFRTFIKDADKQRELIEAEAIATNESAEARNLERARLAYEQSPTVPDVINQYGSLLRKHGSDEALRKAHAIYQKGFADTNEYRFKMLAGDIEIDEHRRKVRAAKEQLEAKPDDPELKSQFVDTRTALLELQSKEYAERVEKYPTDRHRKFELGQVQYELGRFDDAMAQFQAAKDEPRLRVRAGHMLGKCFAKEQWHMEAIAEYKEAINAIDATEKERELAIRYDLMTSLIEHAREERSIDIAREALDICSGIARKNITYRDIRGKRKEIDQLIRDLTPGASSD